MVARWGKPDNRCPGVSVDRFFHRNPHVFHRFCAAFPHSPAWCPRRAGLPPPGLARSLTAHCREPTRCIGWVRAAMRRPQGAPNNPAPFGGSGKLVDETLEELVESQVAPARGGDATDAIRHRRVVPPELLPDFNESTALLSCGRHTSLRGGQERARWTVAFRRVVAARSRRPSLRPPAPPVWRVDGCAGRHAPKGTRSRRAGEIRTRSAFDSANSLLSIPSSFRTIVLVAGRDGFRDPIRQVQPQRGGLLADNGRPHLPIGICRCRSSVRFPGGS